MSGDLTVKGADITGDRYGLSMGAGADITLVSGTIIGTPSTLGKYGRMREQYLREHLTEIDQTANRRLEQLLP